MNKRLCADIFCRGFPAIMAVIAIFQYVPASMFMKVVLSILTLAVAIVSLVMKQYEDTERHNLDNEMLESNKRMCELVQKLVDKDGNQSEGKRTMPNDLAEMFVRFVSEASNSRGYKMLESLVYEFAIVFKWWNDDRSKLLSVARITADELFELFAKCDKNVKVAAQEWLSKPVMPIMRPGKEMRIVDWSIYVPHANSVLTPIAVEGFGFSTKIYLHSDTMSIDFFSRNRKNVVTVTQDDLMRMNGMSVIDVGREFAGLLVKAGHEPLSDD